PQHPGLAALQELAAACPDRLEIAIEPAEVTARIIRCHFAVTAGNGWSLELACVGIPQLVIVQNELHWPTAQRLEEEGAAVCLGWHADVSANTFLHAVRSLLGAALERQAISRYGLKLITGTRPTRISSPTEDLLRP